VPRDLESSSRTLVVVDVSHCLGDLERKRAERKHLKSIAIGEFSRMGLFEIVDDSSPGLVEGDRIGAYIPLDLHVTS
jgi:hypothetical protein